MQGPAAQNREEGRIRKPNGGRGFAGNTLDQRQRDESPLGYTLGRRREEKEVESMGEKRRGQGISAKAKGSVMAT